MGRKVSILLLDSYETPTHFRRAIVKKVLLVVMMCCFAAAVWAAEAVDFTPKEKGWHLEKKEKNYHIYTRNVKGSDLFQTLMIGIMDATPAQCFSVVTDYNHFADFMPYFKYVHIIHTDKVSANETINYVFYFIDPPLLDARYYTLKLTDEKDPKGEKGAYLNKWDLVTKGIYHKTPESPGITKILHGKTGIETPQSEGYWLFQPLDGGKRTKTSFFAWMNSGGNIPHWIANKANLVELPKTWGMIAKRAAATKVKK